MTQITLEKQKGLWKGCFDNKIKNFHKSKVDGLEKLPTRSSLFNDLMHPKGCPYINHKISCNLSCTSTIFLKYHLLMVDSFQIRSGVLDGPKSPPWLGLKEEFFMVTFVIMYSNNFLTAQYYFYPILFTWTAFNIASLCFHFIIFISVFSIDHVFMATKTRFISS